MDVLKVNKIISNNSSFLSKILTNLVIKRIILFLRQGDISTLNK